MEQREEKGKGPEISPLSRSTARAQEGRPVNKMGAAYIPSGSEDHILHAQAVALREGADHERRIALVSSPASGTTNPLEPPAKPAPVRTKSGPC